MYLFVFDDGGISSRKQLRVGDLDDADSGYVEILDVSDPENPMRRSEGDWVAVEHLDD